MNKWIVGTISFAIGTAVGCIVSYKYAEEKYKKIADEEIESVKAIFSKPTNSDEQQDDSKNDRDDGDDVEMKAYEAMIDRFDYNAITSSQDSNAKKKEEDVVRPYVIKPEEFGELDDYTCICLTFYKDHILADDCDYPIENVEEVVGTESLNHFGEYEDETVYVRNDKLKCDYEICLDTRTSSEAFDESPYRNAEAL